jgi:hypothetical protein
MITTVKTTYDQLQNAIRMEEMALRNLRNIGEVKSFDDFMDWYNRQLYLERQAESRFKNMNVKIGGQSYAMGEIENIPGDLQSSFKNTWDNGLTDSQRRQMWQNLGLTPANYAYVKTWEAKEKELAISILTKRQTRNDEAMTAALRESEIADKISGDQFKSDEQKMSDKTLLALIAELMMGTNRAIRDMHNDQLEAAEMDLIHNRQEQTPPPETVVSPWNNPMFGSITEKQGEFVDLYE